MRKTLVGLFIPAAQQHFDLLAPSDLKLGMMTELMLKGGAELCEGWYSRSQTGMLTLKDPDMLLHPDKTLADYGIEDGAQLVLF